MKELHIMPGVCGLTSVVKAEADEDGEITLQVESQCPAVCKMAESMEMPLDAYECCFVKPGQGPIYEAAENLTHGACPVPSGMIKCIEAEAGLALPKNVTMEFV